MNMYKRFGVIALILSAFSLFAGGQQEASSGMDKEVTIELAISPREVGNIVPI